MNLHGIFSQPTAKTAAATGSPTAPPAQTPRAPGGKNAVQEAVKAASEEARTKVASQTGPTPAEDLEKIAAQVAERDRQGTLKEAHDYGRAICDGFMSQLAVYEKIAAEQSRETDKTASAAYDATAERVEQQIHKVASAHYVGGYEIAKALVA